MWQRGEVLEYQRRFFLSLRPLDCSSIHDCFMTTMMTTIAEMADVDADLGSVLGAEGGTKKTGWKTRDGAGDVVAFNVCLDDSVGEEVDFLCVARFHYNLSVGNQAVKRDGSNRNCQYQGMPTLRGDRRWRQREQ